MKPSIKRIALRYVDIIDSENIFEKWENKHKY